MSYPTVQVRLRDVSSTPRYMTYWERVKYTKIHVLTELVAEMLGVFLYVYAGVGSAAAFVVGNVTTQPIGSLFTVGVAYSIGIMLAIVICGAASAGHFNPGVTISFVLLRKFSVRKAVLYILAQTFGAYVACLVVYVQWKDLLVAAEGVLVEKGLYDTLMFTPDGPAGAFALYVLPGTNLYRTLLNEFVTDFVIGLAISTSLDPTNHMVPPAAAPWVIGFTYGMAIWGFSPTAIAANTARDVGARFMTLTIWGRQAAGGPYAAIAALTNIPATVLAFIFYDTFLGSSSRTLTPSHVAFLKAHKMYREENGLVPAGYLSALEQHRDSTSSRSFDEKQPIHTTMEVSARNV
ncbi:aquaporin-like protein [Boletus edulis]|uniref:Aquaporin-like protein n=1 Tax=Boletus edulis BED1 TaxID=1328754 RepID=A0AAD4GFT5_BOLED|nr:aquaporin-like protein [Boletus edulis]KAF8442346.1 aquaporin-like protein [Boletus edulis BED1]